MTVKKRISKSTMSMFFRTACDRELYLSLHTGKKEDIEAAGLSVPLKSRPGVQIITKAGNDFERGQYEMLVRELPGNVVFEPSFNDVDLLKTLSAHVANTLIIQPAIEPETFRDTVLGNLGLSHTEQSLIPPLSGMRPDLVYAWANPEPDWEVLPDGRRSHIDGSDGRIALSVIDLKNVQEGNASYAAEVCLYSIFLSNYLSVNNLDDQYYVSHQCFLWSNAELFNFSQALIAKPMKTPLEKIDALRYDWEPVNYLLYMPSVLKFFREDLIRVITIGDTSGWKAVDYHVSGKCNACDWLGVEKWLNPTDKIFFQNNPENYCSRAAETQDHLCRLPGLSKGARQILSNNGVSTVNALAQVPSTTPAILGKHTFLKRERNSIEGKAQALLTNSLTTDANAIVAGLARDINLEIDITVNFDASSGYLTGIGFRANLLYPYGSASAPERLSLTSFVNPKDEVVSEWGVVQNFIEEFVRVVDSAVAKFGAQNLGNPKTQIYFWEVRQYEELCKAFSRHLGAILALPTAKQKSLAWVFPPDELIEKEDGEISPAIVFIQDIIQRIVNTPIPFALTLLRVAEEYHLAQMPPQNVDNYYQEPLGNSIPRERIYEIWKSPAGVFMRGSRTIMVHDAIADYGKALRAQAYSLATITARLRNDFRGKLKGSARVLRLQGVSGKRGVADDSKLWAQWELVNAATSKVERVSEFTMPGERLESSFKAIVLTRIIRVLGPYHFEFEVSPDSTESKLEEGNNFLSIGSISTPGFLLQNGFSLGVTPSFPYPVADQLRVATHKFIAASLIRFDRVNRVAEVEFRPRFNPAAFDALFQAAMNSAPINNCASPVFLMESAPYDDSDNTINILEAIGHPVNSKADRNAVIALGRRAPASKAGTDPATPASTVLWEANKLAKQAVRNHSDVTAIVSKAKSLNRHPLNPSQIDAIKGCAKQSLSIIWGPPGTGKTDTLSALIHALASEAIAKGSGLKILLTGPNYRAVQELIDRTISSIENDASCVLDVFSGFSRSREPVPLNLNAAHLGGGALRFTNSDPLYGAFLQSMQDVNRVTIVGTAAHALPSMVQLLGYQSSLAPIFDLTIIDESSQVPVTLALRALAVLKDSSQLVIAGDHMQMPPIASLDAPVGAEYLVGSIQTYLLQRFNLKPLPLLVNYRSGADIVAYARSLDYPQALVPEFPDLRIHQINAPSSAPAATGISYSPLIGETLAPNKSVISLIHEDIASSQANPEEAELVVTLIWHLFNSASYFLDGTKQTVHHRPANEDEFFEKCVGIVTPHKAQKSLIISKLNQLFPSADKEKIFSAVDTVERFQGGQRHTIIVSFGVGDSEIVESEEEFLMQLERTNVAVSRAMAKCIMIMPKSLAYHLPSDKKIAESARALKSYIDEFCSESQKYVHPLSSGNREFDLRWHERV
ncbi:MAG: AAA family ATPase [Alkalimonas sp.]|nr:AAA family ATPase [Alkalimonas sp.]